MATGGVDIEHSGDPELTRDVGTDKGDVSVESSPSVSDRGQPQGRDKNRGHQRRPYRPRPNPADRKPTLAEFAPELVQKFRNKPDKTEGRARRGLGRGEWSARRKSQKQSDSDDSLRSPLTRKLDWDQQRSSPNDGGRGQRRKLDWDQQRLTPDDRGRGQRRKLDWDQERSTLEDGGRGQRGKQRGALRSRRPIHNKQFRGEFGPGPKEAEGSPPADDGMSSDSQTSQSSSDRRVRKCLWADEVDEAFVEGDDVDDNDLEDDGERVLIPLTEKQLARRQKDIDYGKATEGYKNYVELIPPSKRYKGCPKTPNKHAPYSRRKWDYHMHLWRRRLHNWDNKAINEEGTPAKENPGPDDTASTPSSKLSLSSFSSLPSSPSDFGYSGTPDSSLASASWHHHDDDVDGDWPSLGNVAAPGSAKDWATQVEEAGLSSSPRPRKVGGTLPVEASASAGDKENGQGSELKSGQRKAVWGKVESGQAGGTAGGQEPGATGGQVETGEGKVEEAGESQVEAGGEMEEMNEDPLELSVQKLDITADAIEDGDGDVCME